MFCPWCGFNLREGYAPEKATLRYDWTQKLVIRADEVDVESCEVRRLVCYGPRFRMACRKRGSSVC